MNRRQMDGLYLVLLGGAVFLLVGIVLQCASPIPMGDFKGVYYEARCLLHHQDAYSPSQMTSFYFADGGRQPASAVERGGFFNITLSVNLPTTLFMFAPLAALPWEAARWLWTAITAASFMLAAFLVWQAAARFAPLASGALVAGCLAGSELYLILGNPACIVVSLCVVAVVCLMQNRYVLIGTLCLAIGLLIKPHDVGFVWLYFLLSGGAYRRHAIRTLLLVLAICLVAVFWVSSIAPHWLPELRANLAVISAHGGGNDPGPSSIGGHGIGRIISLQTVFSLVRDEPAFYNPLAYLVCGIPLLLWCWKTLRSRQSERLAWFALAPIAALSMLPVYHRIYDAALILLAIPACAMLCAEGKGIARWAFALLAAAILVTGAIPWAIFLQVITHLPLPAALSSPRVFEALQVVPVPLVLLVVGIFYLLVYLKRVPPESAETEIA